MTSSDVATSIVSAVTAAGADTVFGMPGGGNNLDFIGAAERAGMRFVLTHAETHAAIMAAVYGDLTGTPGVCVVTRGPGAASAVNGAANALLDRQQLVLVTDAVSKADYARIAHQRLDQRALYEPVSKWSATAGEGDVEATARFAVRTAMSHPRGPVHLDYDPSAETTPPTDPGSQAMSTTLPEGLGDLLATCRRPVVLLGVGARSVVGAVRSLLVESAAPVLMTYRARGVIPDSSPTFAGLLTGATTEAPVLEAADLIVMIGVDTVELIPGGWPYSSPVVSIGAWPETSPYLEARYEVVGDLEKLVAELAQYWPSTTWDSDAGSAFRSLELERFHAAIPAQPHGVTPQQVVLRTRAVAPAGTVATVDAGAHMLPATTLWSAEQTDELLISSGLATMGYALPAAIAAALARPDRRVICFIGDGGLGMCLGELETLSRLGLKVTVVVFNDSRLSLIAIKAKPDGNGGDNAIGYGGIDFGTIGTAYGLLGLHADDVSSLDSAIKEALSHAGPSLVDVQVDPSAYRELLAAVRGKRT